MPRFDGFCLSSAVGWLELGNIEEAKLELEKVSNEWEMHPDTLRVQWAILTAEGNWTGANAIAEYLAKKHPELPCGWIYLAQGLEQEGDISSAYQLLEAVETCFPDDWVIPLSLAVYAKRSGQEEHGVRWLKKAFKLGGENKIREHLSHSLGSSSSSSTGTTIA